MNEAHSLAQISLCLCQNSRAHNYCGNLLRHASRRHADEREGILYDRRGSTITEDLTIDHITDV